MLDRRSVRNRVDTLCKPGHDGEIVLNQSTHELAGPINTFGGNLARPNNGYPARRFRQLPRPEKQSNFTGSAAWRNRPG